MRVFAKSLHIYHDAATSLDYQINGGTWAEIPAGIAQMLVEAHPAKLFILKPEQNTPDDPVTELPKQEIVTTEITAPVDREMKPKLFTGFLKPRQKKS